MPKSAYPGVPAVTGSQTVIPALIVLREIAELLTGQRQPGSGLSIPDLTKRLDALERRIRALEGP